MAAEIERKFLLDALPSGVARRARVSAIRQGYLRLDDGRELRLRGRDGVYYLTEKRGHGLSREETEIEIDAAVFELLWPSTAGRRLEKRRYTVYEGNHTFEIDVFEGALAGLVLLEVEFTSVAEARAFSPPAYVRREVTDTPGYSNSALAAGGRPRD